MTVSQLESLPLEIKTKIYQNLFIDLEFHVHDSNFECSRREGARPLIESSLAIFLSSKTTKQDAELIFYECAILHVCPCFLCRTETEDFESSLSPLAKKRLQPLLRLWEPRRTVQSFDTKFKLYSDLQQIEFSYEYSYTIFPGLNNKRAEIGLLIAHARRQNLNLWLKIPQFWNDPSHVVMFGVECLNDNVITIVTKNRAQGLQAKEFLFGLKHWLMVGEDWASARREVVLDETNTELNFVEVDSVEDWSYRYRYECVNGRRAAVRAFGRHA